MLKSIISTITFALALSFIAQGQGHNQRYASSSEAATTAVTNAKAAALSSEAAAIPQLLAQAHALYAQRDDLTRVAEALKLLRQAMELDPGSYDVSWRMAKYSYYLAAHTTDKPARNAILRQGIAAGEMAVKLQPEKPEGHFWLGANLGERARSQGALRALGTVSDLRREMETVLKIDESYQNGSAYMVLGQIDLEVPGLVGGSKKRALERLEKGLAFGKQNAFLRLRLAEAYLAVKKGEEARQQLNAILAMKPDPDYLPEYKEAATEARKILGEL